MWLPELPRLWLAATAISIALSLLLFSVARRRPLTAGLLLLLVAPLSLAFVLISQDLISYRNLSVEQRVASVFVAATPQQAFILRLDIDGQAMPFSFPVYGDEWRLEARVLRWDKALAKAGLHNLVRLERLSGRYRDPKQESSALRSVHPLPSGEWLDNWQWLREQRFIWRWVEVDFGSGVYAPLRDGAVFGVYLGRSGLFVRPENPIAIKALRDWSA
ncbi:hypothetical protein [Spongiibacter sp.]|uniref:hypothetical protein n=1 Tax=Spongiibacter sp. TaxID=2024860 RepID=UPI003566647C